MSVNLKCSFERSLHFNNDPLQTVIADHCKWGKTPPTLFGGVLQHTTISGGNTSFINEL